MLSGAWRGRAWRGPARFGLALQGPAGRESAGQGMGSLSWWRFRKSLRRRLVWPSEAGRGKDWQGRGFIYTKGKTDEREGLRFFATATWR